MQRLIEFVANHALLSGAFVAAALLLLWTEVFRRGRGYRTLGTAEAVTFMNRGDASVIDVSSAADFDKGHIIGARNMPLSRLKEPDREVQKLLGKPLLLICKTGQTAAQAASFLVRQGAAEVAVLKGGMSQWTSDQYPVTRKK